MLKNGNFPQQQGTGAKGNESSQKEPDRPPNTIIGQAPEAPIGDGRTPAPPPRPWVEGETEQVYRDAMKVPTGPGEPPPKKTMVVAGATDEELAANAKQEEVTAATTYVENRYAGYLPAGTFAEGALLTGVDAGASELTRANPQPVLIRIQKDGTTAGDASYALATCFLIGQAYGDLSSERAYVTVSKLSCVDSSHSRILESPLTAYVVDSDGTIGLRGKLIERNGQLIAKSILTGIFSGLGSVASQVNQANAQNVVSNGITGGYQQSSVNIDAGSLAAAAGFQGVANASQNLSQFFLKQAESIFPVIFVPSGRKVTIVVQEGQPLKWETYGAKFTKVVTPQGG
jgi:conjugal transfer pilus assembly protein TraB